MAVQKLENNKLKFISGHDAETYLTNQTKLIYKISNLIKTSPKSIFQELERIYTNNINMKKELLKNKYDILNLQLRNTVSKIKLTAQVVLSRHPTVRVRYSVRLNQHGVESDSPVAHRSAGYVPRH